MVDFAHINNFTIYIHDIRRHPFMISTGQINALLTIIIPLLDKMKFQN